MAEEEQQDQRKFLIDKNNNIEYIRGKLLGTGGFAKCFQAINQQNQIIYAAKVIPKKSINQKRQRYKLLVQIKIHRSLKHKHIVEFIQTFEDRQNVYILLEYCQNYTLKDLVKRRKRITQYQTRIYIQQIVKALVYIHSQSIIHRDLKLGNILINQHMDTKICDFGLSTRVKHEGQVKKTICGTPNYIAPQILQENGHSYQVDIWSIGVIMYTLLFGKPPFQDNTVEQTYQNIKTNRFSYPPSIPISNMAKDLINRILVTNPLKRISLQQILQHDFMRYREQLPRQIPSYTIAIPPFKIMEIQSRQLSRHDTQMQMSDSMRNNNSNRKSNELSNGRKLDLENSPEKDKLYTSAKSQYDQKSKMPLIYIKECFAHQGIIGYLLSTGTLGICYKNTGVNVVLEYGSENYYLINKGEQIPKKKPFPIQDFQKNYVNHPQQLQHLQNFRTFFLSKYGIFKLDEMHKKYLEGSAFASYNASNRVSPEQELIFIKKLMILSKGQILTRLNNSIIQLHFNDLTALMINHDDNTGIFYVDEKGKCKQIQYNECKDKMLKTKIRMFSNLLEKLYTINKSSSK